MNKKLAIMGAAIVMIIVVVIMGSTYYSTLMQMQEYQPPRMSTASVDLTNGSPILGSPDAPITIIEFGDYQCEMCYHWFHNTRADIINTYVDTGKANLVFLDLPSVSYTHLTLPTNREV